MPVYADGIQTHINEVVESYRTLSNAIVWPKSSKFPIMVTVVYPNYAYTDWEAPNRRKFCQLRDACQPVQELLQTSRAHALRIATLYLGDTVWVESEERKMKFVGPGLLRDYFGNVGDYDTRDYNKIASGPKTPIHPIQDRTSYTLAHQYDPANPDARLLMMVIDELYDTGLIPDSAIELVQFWRENGAPFIF